MRSRPDVDLKVPSRVEPGETLVVSITVDSRSPTPIDFIDLRFTGGRSMYLPNMEERQIERFFDVTERLAEAGALEEKTYRYEATFEVPEEVPASYQGSSFSYVYTLHLTVSIPWWPDAEERRNVTVARPAGERPRDEPILSASLRGDRPFVELSLPRDCYAPGETIEGAVAFGNTRGKIGGGMDLALVGLETSPTAHDREAHRYTAYKSIDAALEGKEVPIRFAVPADAAASFEHGDCALRWVFEVGPELPGGTVIHRVPVVLGDYERRAEQAGKAKRERVGASRWHKDWRRVGKETGLAVDPIELLLTGTLSGCEVAIQVDSDDDAPSGLAAEIRWPSWELGLALRPARVFESGMDLGRGRVTRRFHVEARDPRQLEAALVPELRAALCDLEDVRLSDEQATARVRSQGHEADALEAFVEQVAALCEAVAKASEEIPPPPDLVSRVPAWRRFAEDTGGRLEIGRMRIVRGSFEGARLTIATEFDEARPVGTKLALTLDPPVYRGLDASDAEAVAAAPEPVRELLSAVDAQVQKLLRAELGPPKEGEAPRPLITQERASIRLGVPLADPLAARELLSLLLQLGAAVRGDRRVGPYR